MVGESPRGGKPAGQTIELLPQLRKLIRDYPAGLGVAKEFIQNADDAGATYIRFTLDLFPRSASHLPLPGMKAFMGPSLLIDSDQSFTDEDLHAIQRVGEGSKLLDVSKTGRFGLGFNTSYSLTDYPAFATRDLIMCFDPLRDTLAKENERPGWQWFLEELIRDGSDWLGAFGICSETSSIPHTVFRLPLRTPDQASLQRLSGKPVVADDIVKLFDEVVEAGTSLLLFTRHVTRLELQVIHEDGTKEETLRIDTRDPETIRETRDAVYDHVIQDAVKLVEGWTTYSRQFDRSVWQHVFDVTDSRATREERWLVAAGLVDDADGRMLAATRNMVEIGEKAIPLVGAAARLVKTEDGVNVAPTSGKVYCTLPLPDETSLKFHVNGFFDLNSSRTHIFHDSKAIGDALIRREWNLALLQCALPLLAGEVFKSAVGLLGPDGDPRQFYDLWPDLNKLEGTPLDPFGEVLYRELSEAPILRSWGREGWKWRSARDSVLPSSQWSEKLKKALIHDRLDHLIPEPPPHLQLGLQRAESKLKEWLPNNYAAWLRQIGKIDVPYNQAPLACLRDRKLISEQLRYVSSLKGIGLLGLPLALRANDQLTCFGARLFLANKERREIFSHVSERFIHPDLEEGGVVNARSGAGLEVMTALQVVEELEPLLKPEKGDWLPWVQQGSALPNDRWLMKVVTHLSDAEFTRAPNRLKALALIPDQFGRLHRPGLMSTPLLAIEGCSSELLESLTAFDVGVVTGPAELLEAIRRLNHVHGSLVWTITGTDVIDLLSETDHGISLAPDSPERHLLLDWLATENERATFNDQTLKRLRALALWPTQDSKDVVSADTPGLYLSTGYEPPSWLGKVRFLASGPRDRWTRVLEQLDIQKLGRLRYVREIFLPTYAGLDSENQHRALHWLKEQDIFEAVRREDGLDAEKSLRSVLRAAPLVQGNDGQLHAGLSLIHPEGTEALQILGPSAIVPEMDAYEGDPKDWLRFFVALGLRKTVAPQDILRRAKQLAQLKSPEASRATRVACISVLRHLAEHWSTFSGTKFKPSNKTLAQLLQEIAWLPAVVDARAMEDVAGFRAPEGRLYKADELHEPALKHIVASQAPILDLSTRNTDAEGREGDPETEASRDANLFTSTFLGALGIRTQVEPDVVVAHFCYVHGQVSDTSEVIPSEKAIDQMALATYRALGKQLRDAESKGKVSSLHSRLASLKDIPSIWHPGTRKFWPAEHAFSTDVPFFEPLRVAVKNSGDVGRCLDFLGRRQEPEQSDFISFLADLRQATEGRQLGADEIEQAIHSLFRLDPASEVHEVPLLTENARLLDAANVVLDDAPWWSERLRQAGLSSWLHPSAPTAVALDAGCTTVATHFEEVLLERADSIEPDLVHYCEHLRERLAHPAFREGLLRLLQAAGFAEDRLPDGALCLEIRASTRMKTGLVCERLGIVEPIATQVSEAILQDASLYVATADPETALPLLAEKLEQVLNPNSIGDRASLEAILRVETAQIERVLNTRKIPPLRRVVQTTSFEWKSGAEAAHEEKTPDHDEVGGERAALGHAHALKPGRPIVWDDSDKSAGESVAPGHVSSANVGGTFGWGAGDSGMEEPPWASPDMSLDPMGGMRSGPMPGTTGSEAPPNEIFVLGADLPGPLEAGGHGQTSADIAHAGSRRRSRRAEGQESAAAPTGDIDGSAALDDLEDEDEDEPLELEDDGEQLMARFFSRESIDAQIDILELAASRIEIHRPFSRVLRRWQRLRAMYPEGWTPLDRPSGDVHERDASAPPVGPRSTRSRSLPSGRGRLRSYLEPPTATDGEVGETPSPEMYETAISYIREQETYAGRTVEVSQQPGCDLEVRGPGEGEKLYIKVIAVPGGWDRRGIRWRASDFYSARAFDGPFALFVVEFAPDPDRRRLHRLRDPGGLVQEFRLDDGWKQVAQAPSLAPMVGCQLLDETGNTLGTIVGIKMFGTLQRLTLASPGGTEKTLPYHPGKHTVVQEGE